jgi:hypothetical protein
VKTAGAAGSLPRMLVTFLLGSVLSAWTLIILPRAEANGYLPAPSMNLLPTLMWVDGPFALSVYAVLILSGSTSWRGSVIGERRRSLALFCRYVLILFLGAALTGLAVEVYRLVTSESRSRTHLDTGAVFLLAALVALWFPEYGVLRQRSE